MEIEVKLIETAIPVENCFNQKFLLDWKNNIDYQILE